MNNNCDTKVKNYCKNCISDRFEFINWELTYDVTKINQNCRFIEGRSLKVSELFLLQSKLEKKKVNEHKAEEEEEKLQGPRFMDTADKSMHFSFFLHSQTYFSCYHCTFCFTIFTKKKLSRRDFRNFFIVEYKGIGVGWVMKMFTKVRR